MSKYLVGQPAVLYCDEIRDNAGVLTNPASITLTLRPPDGTIVVHPVGDLTHLGVGSFSFDLVASPGQGGTWVCRYDHTSPTDAHEFTIVIDESEVLTGDAQQPVTGPCSPWTDYDEVVARGALAGATDEQIYQAIDAASDVCFQLGGRRWPGVCDATVQVVSGSGGLPLPYGGVVGFRDPSWAAQGWWGPLGGPGAFFCSDGHRLVLPGPILSINAIRVAGVTLDPSAYVIVDWEAIVRVDGGTWPTWGLDTDAVPGLEIDYSYGQAPPQAGRAAAAALARELALAYVGSDLCRLDRRVTSISREGVSENFALGLPGIAESLRDGQTGIPEVDLFVHAHNPKGLRRRSRVLGLGRRTPTVSRRS